MMSKQPVRMAWLVTRNIGLASIIAVLGQVGVCLYENYSDEYYFGMNFVRLEASRLLQATATVDGKLTVDVGGLNYYLAEPPAYAFRITDRGGRILASSNGELLQAISPLRSGTAVPGSWISHLDSAEWFHLAGGIARDFAREPVWVEIATLGDPANRRHVAMLHELLIDVLVPMGPIVALTILFTICSVNRSLRPLASLANQADSIKLNINAWANFRELPLEAVRFAAAVSRLINRLLLLIEEEKALTSRAAHELRTPLAVMLMELGNIQDARARLLEGDVRDMSNTVSDMLTFAQRS
jgi:signal transduction histidine kinase